MTASTRPSSGAPFAAALVLLSGAVAWSRQALTRDTEEVDGEFHYPLDLTDDVFHRLKAGLFVPDCEPLVIRASTENEGSAIDGLYYRFDWHQGSFDVRTSETGVVVIHADREAMLSHLRIWTPRIPHEMTREFLHYPAHPIR